MLLKDSFRSPVYWQVFVDGSDAGRSQLCRTTKVFVRYNTSSFKARTTKRKHYVKVSRRTRFLPTYNGNAVTVRAQAQGVRLLYSRRT